MAQQCLEYPERPCYGLEKARELEDRINMEAKKNSESHKEIYGRVSKLETSYATITTQYGHIMEMLGGVKADVAELKSKPGKRWESVVEKALFAVIGGVLAYLLARVGL